MIYGVLTQLAGPLLHRHLQNRAARGKEDKARLGERLGQASVSRPAGKLVWLHGASVGEAVALLALITALKEKYPALSILVTSGTVTSAEILAKRLPSGAVHQYAPLDRTSWVNKFLDHWQPDLVIWTESEIWPNLLRAIEKRGIPAAMVNGRLSAGSAKSWRLLAKSFKRLLEVFSVRLAQSEADADRFAAFGVPFHHVGNLKLAVEPAPVDQEALKDLKKAIGKRLFWLAASTHPGEEAIAFAVHRMLAPKYSGLLTIIVPRHPARGNEIAAMAEAEGLCLDRRSAGALPDVQTSIYLADTLGELGTFYELSPIAFIGGSLTFDGHSPVEAAQRNVAIVHGPHMRNNASIATALAEAEGSRVIDSADGLAAVLENWLSHPAVAKDMATAARRVTDNGDRVVERIIGELQPVLARAGIA